MYHINIRQLPTTNCTPLPSSPLTLIGPPISMAERYVVLRICRSYLMIWVNLEPSGNPNLPVNLLSNQTIGSNPKGWVKNKKRSSTPWIPLFPQSVALLSWTTNTDSKHSTMQPSSASMALFQLLVLGYWLWSSVYIRMCQAPIVPGSLIRIRNTNTESSPIFQHKKKQNPCWNFFPLTSISIQWMMISVTASIANHIHPAVGGRLKTAYLSKLKLSNKLSKVWYPGLSNLDCHGVETILFEF